MCAAKVKRKTPDGHEMARAKVVERGAFRQPMSAGAVAIA
jgi:hypothetical protein